MKRAIFLDRDNTIILDRGYTYKIEDLEFLPGTFEGLKKLQREYILIILTNQEGIPMGYFKPEDYEKFRNNMHSKLKEKGIMITAEYHCPHLIDGNVEEYKKDCNCHKPKPGMFLQAQSDLNIDLANSWMIGDKPSDIKAGKEVGAKTIGIPSKESDVEGLKSSGADAVFNNLSEIAHYILGRKNNSEKTQIYPKVWGEENWIANSEKYCGKKMMVKEGYHCSYHMHKIKEETFYILSGEIELIHQGKYHILKEGEIFHIKPKDYHSFRALKETVFFEFSTQHFDEDNYRLTKSNNGTHEEWKQEVQQVLRNISKSETKIKNLEELKIIVENLKHQNKKIVTTNGIFDLLHHTHINLLKTAKNLGDILIVLLNSDLSVKKNKNTNPIIPEQERAEMLASIESVDHILIFNEDTPLNLLEELKPNFHVKGGKYLPDRLNEERELLETWSGKLITFESEEDYSTTKIMEKIIENKKASQQHL